MHIAGLISFFFCSGAFARLAPLIFPDNTKHIIPGRYIVVLKDGSEFELGSTARMEHESWLVSMLASESNDDSSIEHQFEFNGITGYTGKFSDKLIENIRGRAEVDFIEPDQVVYALDSEYFTMIYFIINFGDIEFL